MTHGTLREGLRPRTTAAAWRFVLAALAAALMLVGAAPPARAEEYLLGPQDKIRLKVFEWRASRDDIFEWTALNDLFTVGPDGTVSLPFAGTVRAEGLTADQLGVRIGQRLMQSMQLGNAPDTSVEIVQFRPVYVVGRVMQPGQFPYAPNLTVLQAVTLAGGLRTQEDSIARLAREVISEQGDVSVIGLSMLSVMARKARLEAEHANADRISFPAELTTRKADGAVAIVMAQEQAIFTARREGLKTQIEAMASLKQTLQDELTSLKGQLVFHDKQIDLIQKELNSVSSLVNKGIVAAPRQISLERELAQYQSGRLVAETSLLRSRQEINRNDIAIIDLKNRYDNEVVSSLREAQSDLDQLAAKMQTSMALLQDSRMAAPRVLAMRTGTDAPEPIFTIIRAGNDGREAEIAAREGTALEPGDTIKVDIKPIPGLDDLSLAGIAATLGNAAPPAPDAAAATGAVTPTQ